MFNKYEESPVTQTGLVHRKPAIKKRDVSERNPVTQTGCGNSGERTMIPARMENVKKENPYAIAMRSLSELRLNVLVHRPEKRIKGRD